jgi:two-component system response regulator YesN
MLKAIVVDDEKMTRETLYNNIPWASLGFSVVEQASNGLKALELAGKILPDLVLSDIRMPKMNGIELGKELRALYPDCKIIYLSAYTDKEYFKSAIQLSALDYIEKPLVLSEIIEFISSTALSCLEESKRKQKSSDLIQQKMAVDLCKPDYNFDGLQDHLSFPYLGRYRTVLFRFKTIVFPSDKEDLAFHLQHDHLKAIVGLFDDNHIVAHVLLLHHESEQTVMAAIEDYRQACLLNGTKVHISIGSEVTGLNEINDSYDQALKLSNSLFFHGYDHIAAYPQQPAAVYQFDDQMAETFYKFFKDKLKQQALDQIDIMIYTISRCIGTPINYIKNGFFSIVLTMNRFLEERHLSPEEINKITLNEQKFVWEIISSLSTLKEMEDYLKQYVQMIFEQLDNENKQNPTTHKIKAYIEQHAHESNLSIHSIAQHFFLSANYASFIFKKESNTTINQYLTAVRMNKAKALLADNKITLIDIAALVGYSDAKYFARVFKKEVGLTTTEYRERLIR